MLLLPSSTVLEKFQLCLLALLVQLIDLPPVLVEQLVPLGQERVLDGLQFDFVLALELLELLAHPFQQLVDVLFLLFEGSDVLLVLLLQFLSEFFY